MDFRLVDNLICSLSASNNSGSAFTDAEHDLPAAKLARISVPECNRSGGATQQMLGFSAAFPFLRSSSGYECASMHVLRGPCPCPFTTSQWMELEHQALIYKYITANVPIPSYLLNPIRKALEHSRFSCLSFLRPNALGWGGSAKTDPEPSRCRRTDGKKWRCSRDAIADHKYCERHVNRGRHRSRKPVEGGPGNRCPMDKETRKTCLKDKQHAYSLLDPLERTELSMGLGVASEEGQRRNGWGGGPLGEALHATGNSSGQCKALNLIASTPFS
ncbi:growth-regulating factor 6-like isoform X2 [Salvia splendens]|uniref:growth-regulating factor 6-like isoform X2 n=1 Tax=Salvia splendens TaxID=180675 RepID=UPI001C2762EC|nr:growth-regulating factor 6-like isoform X2 [Salvia splendens]